MAPWPRAHWGPGRRRRDRRGRSAIERIIAWTATQNGHRIRLRHTGAAKNNAWLRTRCAAINLRTLLRYR